MKIFFIVPARDKLRLKEKCEELERLKNPYIVVCGEPIDHPNIIYREPRGKYDAINFGYQFIPNDVEVIGLNDVDTKIHNFKAITDLFEKMNAALVFASVKVRSGPQRFFYRILDPLRKMIFIAASGELMLIRHDIFKKIIPLKRCKSEDSYILFKVLELGGKVEFCEESYVTTERTNNENQEEHYKRRTSGGIYQALSMTRAPVQIKIFYKLLPFFSFILLIFGKKGYYWSRGIIKGYIDYLRGDISGNWKNTY